MMDRETVIQLVKDAGGWIHEAKDGPLKELSYQVMERFADRILEQAARICEDMPELVFAGSNMRQTLPDDCAAAIRASIKEVK